MTLRERLHQYYLLTRLHKPIGILLLLWPTLWALWIAAAGMPDLSILLVFLLGVVLMRSAGCVINDYADRHFDPHVARTRERPIAAGRVGPREALILFAVLCLLAFALVLTLNRQTIYLSFGALLLAAVYPFSKRYTQLPQVVLGAAFGWAIPMAFAAVQGEVPRIAWLLFTVNVLWSTVYDTFYAMVDREDDVKIGVKSTAILFGESDLLIVGVLQILMLAGLILVGQLADLGRYFYLGLLVAAGLSLYQQYLARRRDRDGCFQAFLNNNALGASVFLGIFLHYLAAAG
ncbi:MAG TPA: 4-hydroxybenzoate octaprenyltransferase [Gammaproteobacteria bacterium]|nr:4-hydroxybenzoate octaprenyltransferase [Gammaproteobacteria bacterium]